MSGNYSNLAIRMSMFNTVLRSGQRKKYLIFISVGVKCVFSCLDSVPSEKAKQMSQKASEWPVPY